MPIGLEFLKNEAGEKEGLGDAGIEMFKDAPYASCAREAGQNSRDASVNLPVKMTFDAFEISSDELPFIAKLREAVDACQTEVTEENDVDFFKVAHDLVSEPTVRVLRISDYNTTGLVGPPDQNGTPFHALVKAAGVPAKPNDTAGGSFGIGKNASFAVTDLQTVLYATRYVDPDTSKEMFAAQGKVKLVSHRDGSGTLRRATGYWGETAGFVAVTDPGLVPTWLQRNEIGTSIFCIGFRQTAHWAHRIGYSLITNFFAAIHREEMEFEVDGGSLRINRNTLGAIFEDQQIRAAAEEAGHLAALEFSYELYQCLISAETNSGPLVVSGLGGLELHILLGENLPKRVGIIRNGMLIADSLVHFGDKLERFAGSRDFIALLEPTSHNAIRLLRSLENPTHDGFSAERIANPSKREAAELQMRHLAKELRRKLQEHTAIAYEDEVTLDDLDDKFAEPAGGNRPPDPNAEEDPERFTFKPPPPRRHRRKAAAAKGSQGGRGKGGGGGGTKPGTGPDKGSGSGGHGHVGTDRPVPLNDLRNIELTEGKTRRVYFTPTETGRIALGLSATGVNGAEPLRIVGSNLGNPEDGIVWIDVKEKERVAIELEFDEPYPGPIEANATAQEGELEG